MASTPTSQSLSKRQSSGRFSRGDSKEDKANSADSIHVVCRFRPVKANETNPRQIFTIDDSGRNVDIYLDDHDKKTFSFDKIFGINTTQEQVFQQVEGVVDSVMAGFNGTVLAYGQTSAGKSWTMEGPNIEDPSARGVMPRSIDRLFDAINAAPENLQFQVSASYYEIYCEKIRDLLNPAQDNMKMRETKSDGFVIQDITEVFCMSRENVVAAIQMGKANRISAPTLMNAESSRSHSILAITVQQKDELNGRSKRSKLFLVDLAGSEKVSKTGASGLRLEEAKNINSSLTTLGMVINSLCDGSSHVPYRDSKLTRLLMESLGGNSRTTMIICCAPESRHMPETVSTLRFGERAKHIKNHAKINEELSVAELQSLLAAAKKEIVQLKKQIAILKSGGSLPPEEEASAIDSTPRAMKLTFTDDGSDALSPMAVTGELTSATEEALDGISPMKLISAVDEEAKEVRLKEKEAEIAELQAKLENEVCSAMNYKSRIQELEESLDNQARSAAADREAYDELHTEAAVLRASVSDLEERLLKVTLEARRSRAASSADSSAAAAATPGRSGKLSDSDADPLSSLNSPLPPPPNVDLLVPEPVMIPLPPPIPAVGMGYTTVDAALRQGQAAAEGSTAGDSNSAAAGGAASKSSRDPSGAAIAGLKDQSQELRLLLEQEIRTLENIVTTREIETMNAQASASSYAAKYTRLREEYEQYIQRLMLKLTQEQQARTHVEDRLEDAMQKIWMLNNGQLDSKFSTPKKSFLGSLFGGGGNGSSGSRRMSISGPSTTPPLVNTTALSNRELNLSRALEMAQARASQLNAELTANKEAHAIVLETKESVMRSLLKQNSQLTHEAEVSQQRIDELTATVDQLTRLLRSVQQQYANNVSVNRGGASTSTNSGLIDGSVSGATSGGLNVLRRVAPNTIHGGGKGSPVKSARSVDSDDY